MSKDKPVFNVRSFNQQGGITAGEVNIGPQPRNLNSDLQKQLRSHLPSGKKVTVTAVMGDGEAFQFAQQVKEFLVSQGYDVSGVDQAVYAQPVMGQNIERRSDDEYQVIIGTRQ